MKLNINEQIEKIIHNYHNDLLFLLSVKNHLCTNLHQINLFIYMTLKTSKYWYLLVMGNFY